jgi:glyoxylase-like metal-dependent hydrolase (beta-lactamase superfamily II)
VGEFSVNAVREVGSSIDPLSVFPDATPQRLAPHRHWLEPHFMTAEGRFRFVVRTYVIRTNRNIILVDTCFGNHKERSGIDVGGHMLQTGYLEDLARLGVVPEAVDFVFCTHLHPDHVGWNTRLVDGRWVPTFPNARYLFGADDWSYFNAIADGVYGYESLQDSVLPIVKARQAVFYGAEHEVEPGVVVAPSPGHTPGHSCLCLDSAGEHAVFIGDLMHHPIQCAEPTWEMAFGGHTLTMDVATSAQSRRRYLEQVTETNAYIFAAHWNQPQAERVRLDRDVWRLQP